MTRDDIKRIANECGYGIIFRDTIGVKGNGKSHTSVIVYTHGKQHRKEHSLGRPEAVMELDQETLVARIREKFADREKPS